MRQTLPVHRDHRRSFADNRYVYAVVSRRSRGVSLGVNLNPDTVCNFDCVYCQVDRVTPPAVREVDEALLLEELGELLDCTLSGELYTYERFQGTPQPLRRLNDIAFSGDGEPTSYPRFPEIVAAIDALRLQRGVADLKLVLISNATLFHRPRVRAALSYFAPPQGEVWAKLDAGTQEYYRTVERTTIPLSRVLENLVDAAREQPLVIQSLFMRLHDCPPPESELNAYCDRLQEILQSGGRLSRVQIYTVARMPAESFVKPLDNAEVDSIADLVHRRTGIMTEAFYGAT